MNRDNIIIALMCADEVDNGGECWILNNIAILAQARASVAHAGDCTKQPWTCLRCLVEDFEQRANVFIKVMEQLV